LSSRRSRRTLYEILWGKAVTIDVRGVCTLVLVFDMPTSLKFYRDVLGFGVVATSDDDAGDNVDWCWLRLGKTELMLNGMYEAPDRPAAPDKKRVAAHSDVCLYFGCPDVDKAYRYLRSKGLDVKAPHVASYGMKQLYVRDPDGYNLCFQWEATPREQPVP
jgi:catechol 2,3-dioxygenase-like lactoylglutathione lyase family enzyme